MILSFNSMNSSAKNNDAEEPAKTPPQSQNTKPNLSARKFICSLVSAALLDSDSP